VLVWVGLCCVGLCCVVLGWVVLGCVVLGWVVLCWVVLGCVGLGCVVLVTSLRFTIDYPSEVTISPVLHALLVLMTSRQSIYDITVVSSHFEPYKHTTTDVFRCN